MSIEEILESLRAIVDGAKDRDLTDDEASRYEELETQLAVARRTEQIRSRQQAYETPVRDPNLEAVVHTGTSRQDEELDRAFDHYLRTGQANQDIVELRAQSTSNTAGGYTIPPGFRQKLVDRLVAFGGIANAVEVITTETGTSIEWPTLDDTSNSGVIASEGSAPGSGGSDLTFGTATLGAFTYTTSGASELPLRVSVELLQDSTFDIAGLVARKLGERIARAQAVHWVSGAGTTEPLGITQSTGPSQDFSAAAPTFAELVQAVHSVDPDYRTGARWAFSDATLSLIRQIEDNNGRPLWLPQQESGMTQAPGGMLLGYPVTIDQAFNDYTDATAQVWGVFGQLTEGYVIRRVREVVLVVDPYTRINERQVQYSAFARADGTIQNANAFALLNNVS